MSSISIHSLWILHVYMTTLKIKFLKIFNLKIFKVMDTAHTRQFFKYP